MDNPYGIIDVRFPPDLTYKEIGADGLILWPNRVYLGSTILVIVGLNFAIGFVLGGVDWRGHLGGLIGGTLVTTALNRSK